MPPRQYAPAAESAGETTHSRPGSLRGKRTDQESPPLRRPSRSVPSRHTSSSWVSHRWNADERGLTFLPPVLRVSRRSQPPIARIAQINADRPRVYPCTPWFALLWLRLAALDSSASYLRHSALAIRQQKEHQHRSVDDGKRFEQQR